MQKDIKDWRGEYEKSKLPLFQGKAEKISSSFSCCFLRFFFINENENKEDCKDEGWNLFIHFHSKSKAINLLSLSLVRCCCLLPLPLQGFCGIVTRDGGKKLWKVVKMILTFIILVKIFINERKFLRFYSFRVENTKNKGKNRCTNWWKAINSTFSEAFFFGLCTFYQNNKPPWR